MNIIVTCIAPVNIAVIKYWGKRDEQLILPINDSISATLDTSQLCAKTTVMASPDFEEDRIWLNGQEESIQNPRLQRCLTRIRKGSKLKERKNWKIHICSENNFPTAAGLASSAAGYACLAAALAKALEFEGDISEVARTGSGSGCRSTLGGFVRWYMGSNPDGSDSLAKQIVPPSHWPEMRILILVVSDSRKKVSSAIGMKRSVDTSQLLKYRAEEILPKRVEDMQEAILDRNFVRFAELTMKDSNQMHAVVLDTYPPCCYMNDVSRNVVDFVHSYNFASNEVKVAYTFDAGPNATLYLLEKDVSHVLTTLRHFFPLAESKDTNYYKGLPVITEKTSISEKFLEKMSFEKQPPGLLKYIIHTKVGEGPTFLTKNDAHLLGKNGLPLNLS